MAADTSEWPEVHLGFHSFRSPPDFGSPKVSAIIGPTSVDVLRNELRSAEAILAEQTDIGEIFRHTQVGGWDIYVTYEDTGLVVSSYVFLVFGIQRVGRDLVLTSGTMERPAFPNGDDAEAWRFHSLTKVRPLAVRGGAKGFALDGLFFETSYFDGGVPDASAQFDAYADLSGSDDGNTNSYRLMFLTEGDDLSDDDRPLAMPADISSFPGAKVTKSELEVDGADAAFSRVAFKENGQELIWFDAGIYWFGRRQPEPGALHTSVHLNFANEARQPDEAEARALGMLTSIRRMGR